MTTALHRRPWLRAAAGLFAFVLLTAAPAAAQEPVPPRRPTPLPRDTVQRDTPPQDTVQLPADTLMEPAQDTLPARVAIRFPAMPLAPQVGFPAGVWVWDRAALLREAPVSLIDLLDRIPSVTALRSGMFGQPEVAGTFGGTVSRIEIVRDGFVLDPVSAATFDLSQIPLGQLSEVRVERRLGLLRIRLRTEEPQDSLPYTRVEAGIGEPDANLFRGLFMAPHVIVGPLALGIERLDTDGLGGSQPANIFTGWGKWSWTGERRGVQLEMARMTMERQPQSPWPIERMRQEIVLRARNRFTEGLSAELYGGLTQLEEKPFQEEADTTAVVTLERDVVQAGVRAAWQVPWGVVAGTFRYRNLAPLPTTEAILEADLGLGPVRVGGEVGQSSWENADATLYSSARVEVGPFLRSSLYGEYTSGDRGAPVWSDTTNVLSNRSGWRAGLTVDLGRAVGSLGYVSMEGDWGRPFGMPFDSGGAQFALGPAKGIEAYGRLVILKDWLAVESWIMDWRDAAGWTYLPSRSWRTALEAHALPLASGNLEILARFEGAQRGGMLAYPRPEPEPDPDDDDEGEDPAGEDFALLPSWTTFNGYLQIRVIDVRAFIRWEDILGNEIEVIPGVIRKGPRIFYGVKWNLWN